MDVDLQGYARCIMAIFQQKDHAEAIQRQEVADALKSIQGALRPVGLSCQLDYWGISNAEGDPMLVARCWSVDESYRRAIARGKMVSIAIGYQRTRSAKIENAKIGAFFLVPRKHLGVRFPIGNSLVKSIVAAAIEQDIPVKTGKDNTNDINPVRNFLANLGSLFHFNK